MAKLRHSARISLAPCTAAMDFYIDPSQQYPQETTRRPGMNPTMKILEQVFDPAGTHAPPFKDCVMISLDTEYDSATSQISQVGVTTLDTRDIHKADEEGSSVVKTILKSQLFLLQRRSRKKGAYLYGRPEDCRARSLRDLLLPIFRITATGMATDFRNIILIGHGVHADIDVIQKSQNFDILALPMIKAVVDTQTLMNRVYMTSAHTHSLRNMCKLLGMYRRNIHTAGNDAMYTIKALLLAFCHYKEEKRSWDFTQDEASVKRSLLYECQVEALRRISRCNNHKRELAKLDKASERQHKSLFRCANRAQHHDVLINCGMEEAVMGDLFSI